MDRTVITMSLGPYPGLPLGRSRGPLSLAKGAPVVFRYRIILHAGRADGARIDAESARWAASSQR